MNKTLQTKIAVNDLYILLEPFLWVAGALKDTLILFLVFLGA